MRFTEEFIYKMVRATFKTLLLVIGALLIKVMFTH